MSPCLADSLDLVLPELGPELVSPEAARRLRRVSQCLGPSDQAGFECRLGAEDSPVDLQQGFFRDRGEPVRLFRHLSAACQPTGRLAHPAWNRVREFCRRWSDPASPLHQQIQSLWLEVDLEEPATAVPVPSVFVGPERTGGSPGATLALAKMALEFLREEALPPATLENLHRCVEACEESAGISHLGVMLSRPTDALRLNVFHLPVRGIVPYLDRIGWPGPAKDLPALLSRLFDFVDQIRLCLDVGAQVRPWIGLECFLEKEHELDPRWEHFFDYLVAGGICTPEKRQALLKWHDLLSPASSPARWPDSWIAASLLHASDEFGICRRRLSHVKIVYRTGHPLSAKAYLGFEHRWLQTRARSETAVAAPAKSERPVCRMARGAADRGDRKAIAAAMASGVSFLLAARNQGGWWRDFPESETGSDEWVTAYVGAALAGVSDARARPAACEAWSLLNTRRGPQEGWGYHALLPVDADSTTWALRLAQRLSVGPTERVQQARRYVRRQMRPNGGIACYAREDGPGLTRFLHQEGPYDGWSAVHICITAAAALLDLGEGPLRLLRATQLADGRWQGHWWDDDEYTTARAAEALAVRAPGDSCSHVQRAVDWAARRIDGSGGVHSAAHGGPSAFAAGLCLQILAQASEVHAIRAPLERAVHWLLEHQCSDGSWPSSARLRIPPPDALDPGERPEETVVQLDRRRIFTTATVLAALSMAQGRSPAFREP